MNLEQFISQYGEHIQSYKQYDCGTVRFKFANPEKIMWLKRMVLTELGLEVKTATVGRTYWFE